MHFPITRGVQRADRRPVARRASFPTLLIGTTLLVAACTSTPTAGPTSAPPFVQRSNAATSSPEPADGGAGAVISSLGAVPIPSAPLADPTPTASATDPQLLAMGAPVRAVLSNGTTAVVTMLGPDQLTTHNGQVGPPKTTVGVFTVTAQSTLGTVTLHSADFSSSDQTGKMITLTPSGSATVSAGVGKTATLKFKGSFASGAAQVTWRSSSKVIAIWDFNIELD